MRNIIKIYLFALLSFNTIIASATGSVIKDYCKLKGSIVAFQTNPTLINEVVIRQQHSFRSILTAEIYFQTSAYSNVMLASYDLGELINQYAETGSPIDFHNLIHSVDLLDESIDLVNSRLESQALFLQGTPSETTCIGAPLSNPPDKN